MSEMKSEYISSISLPDYSLWEKVEGRRIPLSFELELTARCNNNCRHCYINLPADDREAQKKELSLEEIRGLADQALRLGALWVLLTGGEPLLRPDFPDIYLELKRKGLLVSVFTNACLINNKIIRLFRQYPPRDLEVTVYGVTKETYEKVSRKPGSYQAFQRGLDLLLDHQIKVRLKAMALRSNIDEFPAIARFCRSKTSDFFRFDPLLHLRFDGDRKGNALIREERLSPLEIAELEKSDPERFQSLKMECRRAEALSPAPPGWHRIFTCGAGQDGFCISHDGRFQLCSALRHPECLYDLRRGTLEEAWTGLTPQILSLTSHDPEFVNHCRSCSLFDLCLWCPAHAYLESGRMDGWVEEFCETAKARLSIGKRE
jgi:radical SAM protein with 4Fe4S-binding SPASM domain